MSTDPVPLTQRGHHLLLALFGVPCDGQQVTVEADQGLLRCRVTWHRAERPVEALFTVSPTAAAYHLGTRVVNGVLLCGDQSVRLGQLQGGVSTAVGRAQHLLVQRALMDEIHLGPLLSRCLAAPRHFTAPPPLPPSLGRLLRLWFPTARQGLTLHAQWETRAHGKAWHVWLEEDGVPLVLSRAALQQRLSASSMGLHDLWSLDTHQLLDEQSDLCGPVSYRTAMDFLLARPPLDALTNHLQARIKVPALKRPAAKVYLNVWIGQV